VAAALAAHPATLRYFEATLAAAAAASARDGTPPVDARTVANWVTGELVGAARDAGVNALQLPDAASPQRLADLLSLISRGAISARMAKPVLAAMLRGDARPVAALADELCGGARVSDDAALRAMCAEVLAEHPKQVALYKGGRDRLMGLFVGAVMQRTAGRADARTVTAIFLESLGSSGGA
jgi:aspartyl-tRNA(Asn)/glutamyl-tRNA(Gln) amidotransferase subunit B